MNIDVSILIYYSQDIISRMKWNEKKGNLIEMSVHHVNKRTDARIDLKYI